LPAISVRLQHFIPHRTYRIRNGVARGLKTRGIGLRDTVFPAQPDSPEVRVLRAQDLGGKVVYDVGADIGHFTSFFADRVGGQGKVVSFEPNPRSYERALEHVRINGQTNVTLINVAVGGEDGTLKLACGDQPGMGSADPGIKAVLLSSGEAREIAVPVARIDSLIAQRGLPAPDFVKIDVEGLELAVLDGMRETIDTAHPTLFIELHGIDTDAKQTNAQRVAKLLLDASYQLEHVESGQAVTSAEQAPLTGHLLCR
jgi:FkbM family methyltransferase